jgi:ribosome biogenesis protein UTP30
MAKKIEKAENQTKKTKDNKKEKQPIKTEKDNKQKKDKKEKQIKSKPKGEEIIEDEKVYTEQEEQIIEEDIKANLAKQTEIVKEKLQLDKKQILKAIKCLKKIILDKYKDNKNLLADEKEEFFYINFIFSKFPYKYSVRPVNVPVPNSLYGSQFNTTVCLFVKDPRSDFKDLGIEFPFKVKVLDIQKLKLKYSRFEERRNLLKQFDLFLCDFRIYMLLKKLLGKPFYTAKKYPVPIKLDYTNNQSILNEVTSHVENCSNYYMTHGPNYSMKISRVVTEDEKIVENVVTGVMNLLPHILKWGVNFEE